MPISSVCGGVSQENSGCSAASSPGRCRRHRCGSRAARRVQRQRRLAPLPRVRANAPLLALEPGVLFVCRTGRAVAAAALRLDRPVSSSAGARAIRGDSATRGRGCACGRSQEPGAARRSRTRAVVTGLRGLATESATPRIRSSRWSGSSPRMKPVAATPGGRASSSVSAPSPLLRCSFRSCSAGTSRCCPSSGMCSRPRRCPSSSRPARPSAGRCGSCRRRSQWPSGRPWRGSCATHCMRCGRPPLAIVAARLQFDPEEADRQGRPAIRGVGVGQQLGGRCGVMACGTCRIRTRHSSPLGSTTVVSRCDARASRPTRVSAPSCGGIAVAKSAIRSRAGARALNASRRVRSGRGRSSRCRLSPSPQRR